MSDTSTQQSADTTSGSIETIANLIKNRKATRIVILTGAGISTSAGVPDFRSPDTGLYAKFKPLKLPYPEAIFNINYFSHTPEPFYAIARARRPHNINPTVSHAFLALLERKGLLHMLFTQNTDGLERDVGIPDEKILAAHGSWRSQRCVKCRAPFPDDLMEKAIQAGEVPYCRDPDCGKAVKPDIVMFGESLPARFQAEQGKVSEADMMIVMGTSLKVHPCAGLPRLVKEGIPRALINREKVGDIGNRPEDVCILGGCDDGVRKLADALGWGEELETLWRESVAEKEKGSKAFNDDENIDDAIEKLVSKMKDSSIVSDGHKSMLEEHLGKKFASLLPKPEGQSEAEKI